MGSLLEVNGLAVRFGPADSDGRAAVDDVSLSIDSGEAVGLLGRSGSGKTTRARALLRLLPGSARDRRDEAAAVLREIGSARDGRLAPFRTS